MLKTKLRWFTAAIVLIYPLNCMALFENLYGYDFGSCTEWEFTTDIFVENVNNPQYKVAASRLKELNKQEPDWVLYGAINHKTYGETLYGICRRVASRFECQKIDGFPLSGGSFTAAKGGGQFSATYRCTESCGNPIQLIYDRTSEDDRNSELKAIQKKFETKCRKAKD